jgi:hypothetical protein
VERRIGEDGIERFAELQLRGVHQPRVEAAGRGRADHRQAIVDPDDACAELEDLFGQRPVAAPDVEDRLARLRREQIKRRSAKRRHESAGAGIIARIPLTGRGAIEDQSVATHSR